METQRNPIGSDVKASVVQQNLEDLFQFAHTHDVMSSAPADNEGNVGDIKPVIVGTIFYIYVKFSSGWKRAVLS